jgi:tetratricopeptide (TPR) repeat protein
MDDSMVDEEDFDKKTLEELKYGFADVLANSPRFNSNEIVVPDSEDIQKYLEKDTLQWLDMKALADSFNVDAVFYLDSFSLASTLDDERVREHGGLFYHLTFQIISTAHWIIHYPYLNIVIDDFKYSEKFVWEAYDYEKEEAIRRLPDYDKTFLEAAYWTGFDYGKRILPTWKKTSRSYYTMGSEYFKKATEMVDSNKWEKAIELWKHNLNHTDAEVVSRAAFNIAFAFEMMGEINLALKWARKSYDVKPKRRTKEYIDELLERKKAMSKLEKQVE